MAVAQRERDERPIHRSKVASGEHAPKRLVAAGSHNELRVDGNHLVRPFIGKESVERPEHGVHRKRMDGNSQHIVRRESVPYTTAHATLVATRRDITPIAG